MVDYADPCMTRCQPEECDNDEVSSTEYQGNLHEGLGCEVERTCMTRNQPEECDNDEVSSTEYQGNLREGLGCEVETTIRTMEYHNRCLHPHHWHSFRPIHFMFSVIRRPICIFCEEKVTGVVIPNFHASSQIVQCAACSAFAHRGCSTSRTDLWSRRKCSVNATYVMSSSEISRFEQQQTLENLQNQHNQYLASTSPQPSTTDVNSPRSNKHASLQLQEIQNQNQKQHTIIFDHSGIQVTPVVCSSSHTSFVNVNEALQENIIANFLNNSPRNINNTGKHEISTEYSSSISGSLLTEENVVTDSSSVSGEDATQSFIGGADGEPDCSDIIQKTNSPSASSAQVVDITSTKINAAAVAGGIAGGLAGLVFAGPAGAYAGFAAASYIVEGTVALGVVVAGIAYGSKYGPQIEEHVRNSSVLEILPRRVLAMGENGSRRKVLLVRPHIQIDLSWENTVMVNARKSAPIHQSKGSLVQSTLSLLRYRNDSNSDADIVQSDENELSCSDKVLLLVNRILNDRKSFPGYVYRFLIEAYEVRCNTHEPLLESCNPSVHATSPRTRRDDAHALIIHVTATLLETRKEFDSPFITELVATAVEGLVLTQLYDLIMEEIREETAVLDSKLQEKASLLAEDFHLRNKFNGYARICPEDETLEKSDNSDETKNESSAAALVEHIHSAISVSEEALSVLDILPGSRTAFDKLQFCVQFLEHISEQHCLNSTKNSCDLSADSLLKRVCQHILIHVLTCCKLQKTCDINGQIAFLEEFARDEHLLRGREGYALVTLQASLHFLNNSVLADLKAEIFEDSSLFEDKSNDEETSEVVDNSDAKMIHLSFPEDGELRQRMQTQIVDLG